MRTLLIALLTAAAGAVLAFIGGDIATKAHHVSDMEGGRAMGIVFLIVPAGILTGLTAGIISARVVGGPGFAAFAKALGLGIGSTALLAVAVFGFSLLSAPRPPLLDGESLVLDFEVRMPPGRTAPDSSQPFTVLFTSRGQGDDRRNAELRLDAAGSSEGRAVIPATAPIRTSTRQRSLVVNDVNGDYFWFDLPLRASPRAADTAWTAWWPAPGEVATSDIRGNGGFQIRYRVRKAGRE